MAMGSSLPPEVALAAIQHTPSSAQVAGSVITSVAIVALIVGGLLAPLWLRMRDRAKLYDLLKHSHDQGQPISPELIGQMTSGPTPTWDKDIRRGAVLLAIAVGLGAPLAILRRDGMDTGELMALSMMLCVCACLGVTFLALGLLRRPGKS